MTAPRRRGIFRMVAFTSVILAAPLVGLSAGVLTSAVVDASATEDVAEPSWIPVETTSLVSAQDISLDLAWDEPITVRGPAWSGLVTAVFVHSGDAVMNGTPLIEVDGIRRLAYSGSAPLFEPVNRDSRESSRAALATFLTALGYAPGDATWGRATLAAVRAFARDIGVPGASELTEFDPAWVVWIPAPEVRIGAGLPAVGSAAGDEVFSLPARLVSIAPSEGEVVPDLAAQKWVLSIGATSLGVAGFPLESPEQLSVFSAELGATEPETTTGTLSLEAPLTGWAVTSRSVAIGADGTHCVYVASTDEVAGSGDASSFRAIEVELLPGSPPGVAWVGGRLPDSAVVLTRPVTAARDELPCG